MAKGEAPNHRTREKIVKRSLVGMVMTIAVFAGPVYAQLNPNRIAILRWYPANQTATFPVGHTPLFVAFDGANIWVANVDDDTVSKR
jgi:hypothetical protein